MDIELLSKMIAELVPDHNEVGLPGLGTFVSEFVPASFTDRGYTITPPYKRVTFVPGDATDNSLVELYARSNSILEDQARAALKSFLEETKKVLLDRKTVVFPGLGRLRATRQNNIFFITDEALDIYPEGFGLEPVSLKNHEETPAEVHHVVESLAGIMVAPTEEFVEPAGAANEPKGEVAAGGAAVAGGIAAATGFTAAGTSAPVPEAANTEYEPIIPADERLEFADEPEVAKESSLDDEARLQKEPKSSVTHSENGGSPTKKAENVGEVSRKEARKADRKAAREAKAAEKAAKAQAKAEAKAAKAEGKAAKNSDKVQASEQRKAERAAAKAARKAERVARKAERAAAKAARREARAAAKAARKPVPKWLWVTPLVILALAALAAAIFFILVYAAPDFLDTLLYTPEELRIINW